MKKYTRTFIISMIWIIIILVVHFCNIPKKDPTYRYNDNYHSIVEKRVENDIIKEDIMIIDDNIDSLSIIDDSLSLINKDVLNNPLNGNEDDIVPLVESIIIKDKIIDSHEEKDILQDSVIHNLEIIGHNFEDMLKETEKDIIILEKKKKRRGIIIGILSGVVITLTTILIVK